MNTRVVEWTSDLETGFADIDEQHKQLVCYINDFYQAYASGNQERMNTVLFDLISCSMNHFEYEEDLMAKAGYPLLEPHRRVHQNFVNKLVDLQGKLFHGEDVAEELLGNLDGWLFRHIKINDRGYINSVNEAGVYENTAEGIAERAQEYNEEVPFTLAETAAAVESRAEMPPTAAEAPAVMHTNGAASEKFNSAAAAIREAMSGGASSVRQPTDRPAETAETAETPKPEEKKRGGWATPSSFTL